MSVEGVAVTRRVPYIRPVFGQAEIDAVVKAMLRGEGVALRIGESVAEFEKQIAALFGKRFGVMCNSGSSALYVAVELLDLPQGSEVITPPLTFSTDIAPLVRAGLVPAFVDIDPLTLNLDFNGIEAMITPKTRAILAPNLAGNAPDWDGIREVADRHSLLVIEDSCDALGPTLRGSPTGTRSDISVTSFNVAHAITCAGFGGMVLLDDEGLRDRGLMLRRWGRRSEAITFGSRKDQRSFRDNLSGVAYDSLTIIDEVGWNFEPSELGAAFGLEQLKKLPMFADRRKHNFARYQEIFSEHPEAFITPRVIDGLDTTWQAYCVMIHPDSGFARPELQEYLEQKGIDSRPVWTGNVVRQPMLANAQYRVPASGLPNADGVLERGIALPCGHGHDDDDIEYVGACIDAFISEHGHK